ncbi:membrane-associated initiation of head vertex [Escherichia phage Lw1]|uniref:Gp40 membrane-associated initiation of head vertex n=2 Tax=Pseudotevenvirus TaxID=2842979 RepID=D9IC96_BPRB1|nr:head vertex assembly chaperone [Escherichia phage RB16]YP_008060561.1 head vertex assembly chaperone [Escherichia phage Lw1]ADJ55339.1 gp40 membrane-associated initiation of head vertex [Escherichia phage RB16]AGJ71446.1 membrane-associated initiation of head vertex [Escherichia phage Lw1]
MDIEQKTQNILDEAMQDVIQELLINDENDVAHLVYIHKVYWDNGLKVEFSTPDENKEALIPLVHDAIYAQIAPNLPKPEKTLWAALKVKLYNFFQMFANLV